MSIIEVMFAILVTVVGLFGAIAVFPAASAMARRGKLYDAMSAAGRSAVHDFDARFMRRPDRWIGYSQYWDFAVAPANPVPQNYYNVSSNSIRFPLGTAFCIDPRMIGYYQNYFPYANNQALHAQISLFPPLARQNITNVPPGVDQRTVDPRMFRISLASTPAASAFAMGMLQADNVFTFDDDLAYERSTSDRSLPAEQRYDTIGGALGGPLAKRIADGHLSWMATLVPKVELVQQYVGGSNQIMAPQPVANSRFSTDEFTLSIVVFNDRTFDPLQIDPYAERVVIGQLQGDGSTGGEILLQDKDPKMLKLRANDWVLLSGVYTYKHLQSGQQVFSNVPAFQWYRVTHCDHEPQLNGNTYEIYATLTGQDWNTSVVNPRIGNPLSMGNVQVTIVEGAVAVYEKTVRLEY